MRKYKIVRSDGQWLYIAPVTGNFHWFTDQTSTTEFDFQTAALYRFALGTGAHTLVLCERPEAPAQKGWRDRR